MAVVFVTVAEFVEQTGEELKPVKQRLYIVSPSEGMVAAGYFAKFTDEFKTVLITILGGVETHHLSSLIYLRISNIDLKIR